MKKIKIVMLLLGVFIMFSACSGGDTEDVQEAAQYFEQATEEPEIINEPEIPLIFNIPDSHTDIIVQDFYFVHLLTDEELSAVLPNFNQDFGVTAIVSYNREDDSLRDISAVVQFNPDPDYFNLDKFAQIRLVLNSSGDITGRSFIMYSPEISDINGTAVTAFMNEEENALYYRAEFILDNIIYRVSLHDATGDIEARKLKLTELVEQIISNGTADLSVIAEPTFPDPSFIFIMTLDDARTDPDFGAYVPYNIPDGFIFSDFNQRIKGSIENRLLLSWEAETGFEDGFIRLTISKVPDFNPVYIISVAEPEKYDIAMQEGIYIRHWGFLDDGVWSSYNHPVFLAEEFTLDVIRAREEPTYMNIDFSVLYGDILVTVDSMGVTPEQLWSLLKD